MEFEWGPQLSSARPDEPKTLTDATLRQLKRDIIAGRLKPGQKLRAQDLTKIYDVGTSPLREALFQLVSDGLVRSTGQRGFTVAAINQTDLRDITYWRGELECEALRRSLAHRTVEWEAELMSSLHQLKGIESDATLDEEVGGDLWEAQHRAFHFTLYGRCGSPWLLRFCELLSEHGERYRRAFVKYRDISPRISDEHTAILNAVLEKRDYDALDILKQHIGYAADLARTHLLETGKVV